MADRPAKVEVIVPCGGSARTLERCLSALGRQHPSIDFRVTVVDSFHDPDVARCAARYEFTKLVRGREPTLGPGPARNLGASTSAADYLAFCDADCAPAPGWLAAAVAALDRGAVAVTGPVVDLVNRPVAIADNLLQFVDFAQQRRRGVISHAPGCNLALRRADFLQVGGFPNGLGEDVRLSTALASRHAAPICFEPTMLQRHAGRRTMRELVAHHWSFGYARGELALLLSRWHERFGRSRLMIPLFVLRRYGYIVLRTAELAPSRLAIVAVLTPLLLPGLFAWALGFRAGYAARLERAAV